MKKHFIIPMALSALTIAPIAAITNIETKNETQSEVQTEFNLDFQDVTTNFENAIEAAKKHYNEWLEQDIEGKSAELKAEEVLFEEELTNFKAELAALETELESLVDQSQIDSKQVEIESKETEIELKEEDIVLIKVQIAKLLVIELAMDLTTGLIEDILETIKIDEIGIVIPDLTKLNLSDSKYSSSLIGTSDTEYEVGFKLDIELLDLLTNNKDPVNPNRGSDIYLNYINNKFTFGLEPQKINKELGQVTGEEWVYDFSSIGEFLRTEHSFEGTDSEAVREELKAYFSVASLFLVEANIIGVNISDIKDIMSGDFTALDIPEMIKDITEIIEKEATDYSLGLEEGKENKITVYGQKFETPISRTSTNNVIDEKYKVTDKTFTTSSFNFTPLSAGAIAGIVIGSIAGVALIGGSTFWFFKNEI